MTDPAVSFKPNEPGYANLIYILNFASFVVGITGVIGVVMAYMARDQAPDWLVSHYNNQIHIFWKSLVYALLSFILIAVVVGALGLLLTVIWFIVRNIKGMQTLAQGAPAAAPGRWGF